MLIPRLHYGSRGCEATQWLWQGKKGVLGRGITSSQFSMLPLMLPVSQVQSLQHNSTLIKFQTKFIF